MTPCDASAPVQFVTDGAIARIVLNRPEKRNAVSPEMAAGLEAALDRMESDPVVRVGLISGAGSAFSAGADLSFVANGEAAKLSTGRAGFAGFVRHPRRKPLVAAVHGFALAGGFEIALACDLIVAESTAQFGLPEVSLGLIASGGGVLRLAGILPRAQALDLVLTGRRLDAAEAAELGLVTRVVEPGRALDEALALAVTIASYSPAAVQESLYLVNAAGNRPSAELWTLCAEIARRVRESQDARERAQDFLDRREALWATP